MNNIKRYIIYSRCLDDATLPVLQIGQFIYSSETSSNPEDSQYDIFHAQELQNRKYLYRTNNLSLPCCSSVLSLTYGNSSLLCCCDDSAFDLRNCDISMSTVYMITSTI